jgi:hypothetical protein
VHHPYYTFIYYIVILNREIPYLPTVKEEKIPKANFNPLNAELNPICYLLALLAHNFLHVSRIRVKSLTLSLLMSYIYIGCFKKNFTILKAYRNLYRGHTQGFELSKCSKTHRVLPRIVIRYCFDLFVRFILHGTSTVTVHQPGKRVLRYSRTSTR